MKGTSNPDCLLNEPQTLFEGLVSPLWKEGVFQSEKHLLLWLQSKIGYKGAGIKPLSNYSIDEIAIAVAVCDPYLERIKE
jgi:hypothetical protein